MAQHDYIIDNQTSASLRADLNNALAAIVSQNSGATAPATTYANQFWYDTSTDQLKQRNETNTVWITLGTTDQTNNKFEPNQTFSTQAEAEAGTDNTKAMTPLRTAQAIAANSGGYNAQIFSTTGWWSKPTNAPPTARVLVQMWGGGGGGARSAGTDATGGGGGAFVEFWLSAAFLSSVQYVEVGAGGSGRSTDGDGNTGGNSAFYTPTTVFYAYGGGGGNRYASNGGNTGGGQLSAGTPSTLGGTIGGGVFADSSSGGYLTPPDIWGGAAGTNQLASGASCFGGAGGAGKSSGVPGVSKFAGNGGSIGGNGQSPAGGGGGSTSTSGAGGSGLVRVYTIW